MTGAESLNRCNSFEEELNRVDPQRERFLLEKIREFLEKIKPGDKVLIACHPDADGYISGALLKAFVDRFFHGQVQAEFCTDELKTREFYNKAKNFKHVITGDLWIDETEEKQQGLRALLKQGINIAVFDHHDKQFPDFAPQRIEEMLASGLEYTLTIPESSQQDLDPRTKGSITYVSPKRLGFHNPDPNKFTGALIIYKMLGQLVDLSDLEFLLPISAKGDCDAGKKYWPKLLEKYAGHKKETDEIAEIAGSLNFGKNLTLPAAERLMTWLASMNGQRNSYKEIEQDDKLSDLRKLRARTRGRVEAVLREGTRIAGRFFHYHVTAEDERAVRKGLNGDLNHELVLDTGLSEALCEKIGNEITVTVTQVRKGISKGFHICFKDERGDQEHDMTVLARLFGGGGHENASGAERKIQTGWVIETVIAQFRSELKEIAEFY